MPRATLLRQRLLTLFLVAMLLLFSPLVLQFANVGRWLGIPALLVYLYCAWSLIIGIGAWIIARGPD